MSDDVSEMHLAQSGTAREVQLRTIDSYEFPKVDMIKIDAEGMELLVVQGAVKVQISINSYLTSMTLFLHKVLLFSK